MSVLFRDLSDQVFERSLGRLLLVLDENTPVALDNDHPAPLFECVLCGDAFREAKDEAIPLFLDFCLHDSVVGC